MTDVPHGLVMSVGVVLPTALMRSSLWHPCRAPTVFSPSASLAFARAASSPCPWLLALVHGSKDAP